MESVKKIDLLIIEITERLVICKAVRSFQSEAEAVRLQNWINELKKIREQIRKDAL